MILWRLAPKEGGQSVGNDYKKPDGVDDFGRLLFSVDEGYWSGETLGKLRLTWYSRIDSAKTVEIVNYLHTQTAVLPMWVLCTTASLKRWSYQKKGITLLP